ncbi:hypothetical protein DOTSEDRAFT_72419 [Dothistroma septosporum NZE10]|uniref:Uncharacterized protein n=1 Tax=Dothistroma septosporum (strain NZE10 / CBS 128990) TaxID=675120 RepID=M2WLU2_DOTSN|nr:hypothetical protein DOTSEDRAFT_72419 [Dothistroma septosporum NZE10]
MAPIGTHELRPILLDNMRANAPTNHFDSRKSSDGNGDAANAPVQSAPADLEAASRPVSSAHGSAIRPW